MEEILARRLARCEAQHDLSPHDKDYDPSFAALPNLIVIDGGKGQLAAGLRALQGFRDRGVVVISLAKRIEEVFIAGAGEPLVLPHDTAELQLLQRLRDEAHRFAITHHRMRRDRAMTASILDELPGVGPARKRALLTHFGSPDAILEASREELEAVPGIPGKLARELHRELHKTGVDTRAALSALAPVKLHYHGGAQAWISSTEHVRVAQDDGARALRDLVVITGFSGAGKSTAMAAFEDEGYFCVDNLPSEMISSLVELFIHAGSKVACGSRLRRPCRHLLRGPVRDARRLQAAGVNHRVLFLEASEESLQTRYKETRRRHPLSPDGSVADGIARERELLAPLRARADVVIDTTGLTAAKLRRKLADEMLPTRTPGRLAVTFESFGFKYGPARDPDLMFDVRFLPNPHYEPAPAAADRPGRADRRVHRPRRRARRVLRQAAPAARLPAPAVPGRGQGTSGGRDRLHRRAPPLGRDRPAPRERYNPDPEYLVQVIHRDISRPA